MQIEDIRIGMNVRHIPTNKIGIVQGKNVCDHYVTAKFGDNVGAYYFPVDLEPVLEIPQNGQSILPEDAKERKAVPICTGVLDYFPKALAEVAKVSVAGNSQHHPGTPLHWDKSKSQDESDALVRHLIERGKRDTDGQRHSAKAAWRALANLERELDAEESQ